MRGLPIRPRTLALIALLLLLVNGAVIAAALHFTRDSDASDRTLKRTDPVADLLGWLPQTEQTRGIFAVQLGASNPNPPRGAPTPLTLGHTSDWRARFGYGVENVSGWAMAGPDSTVAVLSGTFDWGGIERSLTASGYQTATYHRAVIFSLPGESAVSSEVVDGDSLRAATIVAVLDQRILTGVNPSVVRAAIDAAQGRSPSLADLAPVAAVLTNSTSTTGLVAIDQANQARMCSPGSPGGSGQFRFAIAAFNNTTEPPAGSIALSFESDASAAAAMPRLGAIGRLSNLRQDRGLLLADVTGGAPMNLLFNPPDCDAVRLALATGNAATPTTNLYQPREVNQ